MFCLKFKNEKTSGPIDFSSIQATIFHVIISKLLEYYHISARFCQRRSPLYLFNTITGIQS